VNKDKRINSLFFWVDWGGDITGLSGISTDRKQKERVVSTRSAITPAFL
jgi:hypothetical protein